MGGVKRHAPATERNRAPIAEVLERILSPLGRPRVLEIASGSGQHAVHFAEHLPHVSWLPTDRDPESLPSIEAWREEAGLSNVEAPRVLDVEDPTHWPDGVDAVVCINMIHIAPWSACEALFTGASRVLRVGAPLILYGPYRFQGKSAPSNDAFDASLRARDPSWGVRDVDELTALGHRTALSLVEVVAMPANNHILVWRRSEGTGPG